jgi:hypothetical protein
MDASDSSGDIRTVYLGTFPHDDAEALVGRLVEADIAWWVKQPGFFSQIWERGVRVFVDRERRAEARAIADEVERSRHPDAG